MPTHREAESWTSSKGQTTLDWCLDSCELQDKRKQQLNLRPGQPVGTAIDEFACSEKASKRIPAKAQISFWFDGDKVAPHQTPEELDLEADMVVDVRW